MKSITKAILLVSFIGVPAAAQIGYGSERASQQDTQAPSAPTTTVPIRRKDTSRVMSITPAEEDKGDLLLQLAQAWGSQDPEPGDRPPGSPPFGRPHPPHGAPPMPMMPRPPLGPMTRSVCEDGINREAAGVAFIKSKLRLQSNQREAWRKMEDAAQPAVDRLHAACDRLPADGSARPSPPDIVDAMEDQVSARAELLKAVREPLRALFETLSPEQRMALEPPFPPPHPL